MSVRLALAVLLGAAPLAAAAPDPLAALRPVIGSWTGQMHCESGDYGVGVSVFETAGTIAARFNAASGGAAPTKTAGRVAVTPRAKPGEFSAESSGVVVKVTAAEKGQVLLFEPDPTAIGLAALVRFSGAARLDKTKTKATVRYSLSSPLGKDPCMGSMVKAPAARSGSAQ